MICPLGERTSIFSIRISTPSRITTSFEEGSKLTAPIYPITEPVVTSVPRRYAIVSRISLLIGRKQIVTSCSTGVAGCVGFQGCDESTGGPSRTIRHLTAWPFFAISFNAVLTCRSNWPIIKPAKYEAQSRLQLNQTAGPTANRRRLMWARYQLSSGRRIWS